jgi:hypothetical protein
MNKLPIADAGTPQLIEFAKIQQIENVPTDRAKVIAALVESGWTQDYILAADAAAPPGVADVAPAQAQTLEVGEPITEMPTSGFGYWRDAPMVVCKIMSTDRPGGNEPAHPSINGSPHLVVQRNVLVRIPHDFYLVIKQAGGTKLVPGAKAEDPLIAQHYLEYPMSDVQLPTQAEIDAWRAKTEGDELGRPKQQKAA